jgi:hypothetical protein
MIPPIGPDVKPPVLGCLRPSGNHKQDAADLRQQRQEDQAQQRKVIPGRPQEAMADPRHDPGRRVRLRVRRLSDRLHSGIKRQPPIDNSRLSLAAEPAHTAFALAIPRGHRVTQCGLGGRDSWRHP